MGCDVDEEPGAEQHFGLKSLSKDYNSILIECCCYAKNGADARCGFLGQIDYAVERAGYAEMIYGPTCALSRKVFQTIRSLDLMQRNKFKLLIDIIDTAHVFLAAPLLISRLSTSTEVVFMEIWLIRLSFNPAACFESNCYIWFCVQSTQSKMPSDPLKGEHESLQSRHFTAQVFALCQDKTVVGADGTQKRTISFFLPLKKNKIPSSCIDGARALRLKGECVSSTGLKHVFVIPSSNVGNHTWRRRRIRNLGWH